jgi:CTP synthase (UTP-ammonia lyase)
MAILRIGLVGDRDESVTAHRAIPRALDLAARSVGVEVAPVWLHTASLGKSMAGDVSTCDGVWCIPASPYANTHAALRAIRFARESARPFLGTCAGFQHALLEYARAAWGVIEPAHAELYPGAIDPVIAPLACALVEQTGAVRFAGDSRIARAYGQERAVEGYHCRYGLGARYVRRLDKGPMRATGWDDAGEVRSIELEGHPFFVATLFQPERAALEGRTPPIVRAFLEAALEAA